MEKSFSRKRLIVELLRGGVPPVYACRVAGELADHAEDLAQSGLVTQAALGNVDLLASQIIENYRKRTFAGRHPILSFAVAPFPLAILANVGLWIVGALLVYASTLVTSYAGLVGLVVHYFAIAVPAMVVAWLVCRLARGVGLNWQRVGMACLPILVVTFLVNSWLQLNALEGEPHGTLMFGLGLLRGPVFKNSAAALPIGTALGRMALPLGVVLWMFVRERAQMREVLSQNGESGDADCDPRLQCARQAA